jgi:hypothetical protein
MLYIYKEISFQPYAMNRIIYLISIIAQMVLLSELSAQNSFELLISSPFHEVFNGGTRDAYGNFYFVGEKTERYSVLRSGYLVKIDGQGNIIKEERYSSADSTFLLHKILITNDTLFIFGLKGAIDGEWDIFWMMKMDPDLNILARHEDRIQGGFYLGGYEAEINHKGNIVLNGTVLPIETPQYPDIFFYEITREFDSVRFSVEELFGHQTSLDFFEIPGSTEYKVVGHHYPNPQNGYHNIVYYDSNFNFIYTDTIAWHVAQQLTASLLDDSTYLVAGYKIFITNNDFGIVKLNMEDDLLEKASFGKQGDTTDHVAFRSISYYTKDNIYLGGCSNFIVGQFPWQTDDDWIYLVNLDSNLNENWQRFYGGDAYYNPRGLIATADGGCVIFGERYDENIQFEEYDVYILKVDSNGLLTSVNEIPNIAANELFIYPNPATSRITLQFPGISHLSHKELLIYNNLGIKVKHVEIPGSTDRLGIDLENLSSGLYYISLISNGTLAATGKFLIAR